MKSAGPCADRSTGARPASDTLAYSIAPLPLAIAMHRGPLSVLVELGLYRHASPLCAWQPARRHARSCQCVDTGRHALPPKLYGIPAITSTSACVSRPILRRSSSTLQPGARFTFMPPAMYHHNGSSARQHSNSMHRPIEVADAAADAVAAAVYISQYSPEILTMVSLPDKSVTC